MTRRVIANLLTALGVALLGYCAVVFVQSRLFQMKEERRLEMALPRAPSPSLPDPQTGALVGRLEIPRLGLSVMVVEGDGHADLKHAAGHIPGTALPWRDGNTGIAAHRDTYFRPLRSIRAGDAITLQTLSGTYTYRVLSTEIVGPRENQVLLPDGHDELTLVTCYPFYYIGPAPKRFIVRAEKIPAGT